LAEKKEALAVENKALAEKKEALAVENKALAEKNKALAEKNKALAEKKEALAVENKALAVENKIFKDVMSTGKILQPLGLVVSSEKVTVLRGNTMTYTVSLNMAPADTVTVKLDIVPQVPDVRLVPASMNFTTANWDAAQTVTITATDNLTTPRTGTDNGTIVHHDPDNNSFAGKTIPLEVKPSPPSAP